MTVVGGSYCSSSYCCCMSPEGHVVGGAYDARGHGGPAAGGPLGETPEQQSGHACGHACFV